MGRVDGIADVSGVSFDVSIEAPTKIRAAEWLCGIGANHAEKVRGDFVFRMRRDLDEFQHEVVVPKLERTGLFISHSLLGFSLRLSFGGAGATRNLQLSLSSHPARSLLTLA
jgi:hypothetical protein